MSKLLWGTEAPTLPRIKLTDGNVETLKWVGLMSMTADHINKYLLNGVEPILFDIGRLAAPIFIFVLAFNLSRPGFNGYQRVMIKLVAFGGVATIPYLALGKVYYGWWPLNIMFTLLAITSIVYAIESRRFGLALVLFFVLGSFVEFWWPAIALGVAVWAYQKNTSMVLAAIALASLLLFYAINSNHYAVGMILMIFAISKLDLSIPRIRWFFYSFYPAHLAIIWLIRIPMKASGYLFF